jgi:hypothetical protein
MEEMYGGGRWVRIRVKGGRTFQISKEGNLTVSHHRA